MNQRAEQRTRRTGPLPGLVIAATLTVAAGPGETVRWNFDSDATEKSPAGFTFARTGDGRAGRWLVRAIPDAPSGGQALAQTDADDTDYRFPVAVADQPAFKDLRLSVKCKTTSGKVDQVCGLVFRYRDENNYYVTRTNGLENNVRLYRVKDGRRVQFGGWNGKVAKNVWHDFAVEARGGHFQVFFNGKKVIDARDDTFSGPGRVGLWTKADSITLFDALEAIALRGSET
jgi:hypothetical protein